MFGRIATYVEYPMGRFNWVSTKRRVGLRRLLKKSVDNMPKHYKANITAGSLLVPESRKVARLLLNSVDEGRWKEAIEEQNILQKRSLASGKRIAALIRSRFELMDAGLWDLVANGDSVVATHAAFAASIKHCSLLGDYLFIVVKEQFHRLEEKLSINLWDQYVFQCRQRDALMKEFPPSTAIKIRSNVHKILAEVGYLKDSRSLILHKIDIAVEVIDYLQNRNENYVLKCIQV